MVYNDIIEGEKYYLRALGVDECLEGYIEWLNNPAVNRFLESRFTVHTLESTIRYVLDMRESDHSYLFSIIAKDKNRYIGNIKIGPINKEYKSAFIGYMIGDTDYWGMGAATEAIGLTLYFGFKILGLHKIDAGVIAANIASAKALMKNGFKKEGELRDEVILDGCYQNTLRFGIIKEEFEANG